MSWDGRRVLITGGASFIGSHLVDALVAKGSHVRVVDDLSSGKRENIAPHIDSGSVEFIEGDLKNAETVKKAMSGTEVVFHLAAVHGGRGFVDTHQAACTANVLIDTAVIREAHAAGVDKFVFASSGCVYPKYLQNNTGEKLYLTEEMVGPPYEPDNVYGWAKLTTEMTLKAYAADYGLKSASCRFFTVYGERGVENHAVIAMIAKAFTRREPYEIWGDGTQIRNWTYVGDIVSGMIRAAEVVEDGSAVNLGTMERVRVLDAANAILAAFKFSPDIKFMPNMPTGPYNRVSDNGLAKRLLGWEPRVTFREGLKKTIEWYARTKNVDDVRANLDRLLFERK